MHLIKGQLQQRQVAFILLGICDRRITKEI